MQNIVISFWSLVQKFRKQYCTKTLVLYVPNLISSTVWVSAHAHDCLCACSQKRDYASLFWIFYVLCWMPDANFPHTCTVYRLSL